MSQKESNAYILGTELAELHRLGLQHQVWAEEACKGWDLAGFTEGQTLFDLGCGPGYCTTELAFIVGEKGKVYGVDKSKYYIDFLQKVAKLYKLPITLYCSDFESMEIPANKLNGIFSRWALAWVPNPEVIIAKLFRSLKKGGTIVAHEYFDWSTLQTEPTKPALAKAIAAALQSLRDQPGNIDIGRKLPSLFENTGFEIISTRPMTKMATPTQLSWNWPKSFFNIYFPKLISSGYLTQLEVREALYEFNLLENEPGATILCPHMTEVIAKKP